MKLLPALRSRSEVLEPERDAITYTLDEFLGYLNEFLYQGIGYTTLGGVNQTFPGQKQEPIGPQYKGLAELAYKSDGVVFACMQTRARHFRQVSFKFRNLGTKKLFGGPELAPLEEPWPGGTTADLLTKMILHADLSGNAFVVRRSGGLALLRPDWVTIIIGSDTDPDVGAWATDATILGYVYSPGGYGATDYEPETFTADEVAHFAPIPDPEARFRGMSWITPLIREVMADKAGVETKLRYWENPTPNMVVKFDVPDLKALNEQITAFKEGHTGTRNAFKFMFGTMGMDATPVGSTMKDLDFKLVMGAGETRIAAAAGTPPVLVGLSEGLQGSALNSGNYQAARRQFVDGVIRDLWQDAAGSLANIVTVQSGSQLWYDDGDVAFVKEDLKERADVMLAHAQTARFLVDAGYKPDTVIDAIEAEDFSLLEHSGLFSVQLQAANAPKQGLFEGIPVPNTQPGAPPTSDTTPNGNGNGNGAPALPATNGNGRSDVLTRADLEALVSEYRPDETHVHFDEGAIRLELPASPDVHIHEGAFRAEVAPPDVHVDAPVTTFEPGAIQVDAPEVRFDEGAIQTTVEAAQVHVDAPVTRFEEGAITVEAPPPAQIDVHVEPTRIEEGAIKIDVQPADVDVTIEKAGKRRVEYGDGRSAVITDGESRRIDFDDGDSVTITEIPEE